MTRPEPIVKMAELRIAHLTHQAKPTSAPLAWIKAWGIGSQSASITGVFQPGKSALDSEGSP